ncbi:MAG: hypothetical protein LBK66_11695 [Spirochaetaceae bacterium]|jgi:hypothetical protein|nr:hypothetical protein [Spirochaetaceae bacterium]
MDYHEWERQKEWLEAHKDLADAVEKTVDRMYDSIRPRDFGIGGFENDHNMFDKY